MKNRWTVNVTCTVTACNIFGKTVLVQEYSGELLIFKTIIQPVSWCCMAMQLSIQQMALVIYFNEQFH